MACVCDVREREGALAAWARADGTFGAHRALYCTYGTVSGQAGGRARACDVGGWGYEVLQPMSCATLCAL